METPIKLYNLNYEHIPNHLLPINTDCQINNESKEKKFGIGSLIQLKAFGPQDQDIYNPQDTQINPHFKSTYFTHNSLFPVLTETNINNNFKFGTTKSFNIPLKQNIMLQYLYFHFTLPPLAQNQYNATYVNYINHIGFRIFKNVKIMLNNITISEYDGMALYTYFNLALSQNKQNAIKNLYKSYESNLPTSGKQQDIYIHIPIFLKQMFPIIALHNMQLNIVIQFEQLHNLISHNANINPLTLNININNNNNITTTITPSIHQILDNNNQPINTLNCTIIQEAVYIIDKSEVTRLLKPQNFIFESFTLQKATILNQNIFKLDLHFNLPIKQLFFIAIDKYTNQLKKIPSIKLVLNDNKTFIHQSGDYFNLIQSFFHNKATPTQPIYSYSFALDPHINQPSGTLDFAKLNKKYIEIYNCTHSILHIYALYYNSLNTQQGLASLQLI